MKGRRILVADDHELFRRGLRDLLVEVLGATDVCEAASLEEALDLLTQGEGRDLILVDLRMPGMCPEALAALRDGFPEAKIAVVSGSEDPADVLSALGAGVHGYIPKSLGADQIAAAISGVLGGTIFVPSIIAQRALPTPAPAPPAQQAADRLTPRQKSVLDELLLGKSSKEIARTLNIAEGTVKIHLASIYRAIGVRTRAEAIAHFRG